jgi:outer membrane protein OmpA-like peptidoglycan-associated protein
MKAQKCLLPLFFLLICHCFLIAQTEGQVSPPVTVQVKNETAINTAGLEFSPTFFEDGIVFISTNTVGLKKRTDETLNLPAMSILLSRRNAEGNLSAPEPFSKELTSLNHEGPVCFDRMGETIFFSRNNIIGGKEKLAKDKTLKMRLYSAKKTGSTWSEPQPLAFNNNQFDDCHPAISIDGDKLFFSSNREGGFGGMDIYVSYKVGDSWSEPVNLGSGVNTKGNELFPFIHADNTLFFASNGIENGKGGLDLYYVIPDGTEWTKPVNMGEPFNSQGDDFALIIDLNKINGYFSSNGNGGAGQDDILAFKTENGNLDDYLLQHKLVPDRLLDLKVSVTEKGTTNTIGDAEIQVMNYDGNNVIGRDENGNLITVQNQNGQDVISTIPPEKGIEGKSDSKGRFSTEVKPGNYAIIISKSGYQTKQFRLPISKQGNELTAQLEKLLVTDGKVPWNPSLFNDMTNMPMSGAMMVVTNLKTGKKDTLITDGNGMVEGYLEANSKYKVEVMQGGKLVGSSEVDTNGWKPNQPVKQNLSLTPLMTGSKIELPNIYYNYNDATLRPDARKDLDLLVVLMNQQPAMMVELASHTDSRGSSKYNEELSQRRANGVVEYMVSKGIQKSRLTPHGYGENEPRNGCVDGVVCNEKQYARNRRTEVRILGGSPVAAVDPGTGKVNTPPGKITVSTATSGAFYVVAGSYLREEGAKIRQAELKGWGFPAAEIVRFPNSTYFNVSVNRYANREEATVAKKKLERENKLVVFLKYVQ